MSQPPASKLKNPLLWCLLLIGLVGAVFYPVLRGEFLWWDDDLNISRNPHLGGLSAADVKWAFTSTTYLWRYQPLCWLMWDALKQFFGLNPFYFHLAVLIFHAANSALVFLLIRELLLRTNLGAANSSSSAPSICAGLAAVLWAIHPMRVETTAWAVELVFVQPLFFFLLSLLLYLRSTNPGRNCRGNYIASVVLFVISLASYPLALGGFVVFVAFDFFPLQRLSLRVGDWSKPSARTVWLEKAPFLAASLLFAAINLHVRMQQTATIGHAVTLREFGVAPRVMQAFFMWAYYIWRPWLPFDLTPVPAHLIQFDPFAPTFLTSAALVIGLTILFWLRRARWPWIFAAWLCHLALLVPMLGLSEHPHFASDRYSLEVSIGWSVLLAGWFLHTWQRTDVRTGMVAAVLGVSVLFAGMSCRQIAIWRTTKRFYLELLARPEPQLAPFQNSLRPRLIGLYLDDQEYAPAIILLGKAVETDPRNTGWRDQLGQAYWLAGKPAEAKTNFEAALRLDPNDLPARTGLASVLAKSGDLEGAKAQFLEALRLNAHKDPALEANVLQNIAAVLRLQGKPEEAKEYLDRARSPSGANPPK